MPRRLTVYQDCWYWCFNYPGIFHTGYGPGPRFTCDSVLPDVAAGVQAVVCIISVCAVVGYSDLGFAAAVNPAFAGSLVLTVLYWYKKYPGFKISWHHPFKKMTEKEINVDIVTKHSNIDQL